MQRSGSQLCSRQVQRAGVTTQRGTVQSTEVPERGASRPGHGLQLTAANSFPQEPEEQEFLGSEGVCQDAGQFRLSWRPAPLTPCGMSLSLSFARPRRPLPGRPQEHRAHRRESPVLLS